MLRLGIYKHYKGREYRLIGVAKHSETFEDFVVYEAMYDNDLSKLWIRPKEMFEEKVIVNGIKKSRFKWIREE